MNYTITREQFKDAIEAGLNAKPCQTPEVNAALREVGKTATQIASGEFYVALESCGCPLVESGITDKYSSVTPFGQKLGYRGGFYSAFDRSISRYFSHDVSWRCSGNTIYKIVD